MRRGLEIQTGVFQNERQLNYLPDGVWLKSLICSHKKGSLITLLQLGFSYPFTLSGLHYDI